MFAFFMYKSGSDVVVATLGRVSLPLHRPPMAPPPSLLRGLRTHLRGPPPGGPLRELSHLRGPRVLCLPMAGLGSWPTGIFPKPSSWETLGFATRAGWPGNQCPQLSPGLRSSDSPSADDGFGEQQAFIMLALLTLGLVQWPSIPGVHVYVQTC